MWFYLVEALSLIIVGGLLALIYFKKQDKIKLVAGRIIPFVLIAIFALRIFSNRDVQRALTVAKTIDHSFLNIVGEFSIWFELTAILFLLLRPFFNFKTAKWYVKYISTSVLFVCLFSSYKMLDLLQGSYEFSPLYFLLPLEIGVAFALSLFYTLTDWKVKISKHSYKEVAICSTLINFASMPSYIWCFVFGTGMNWYPIDFSFTHRVVMYLLLILIPFGLYFGLRGAHRDKIQYTLIFISLGTFLNFFEGYTWSMFYQPWELPLHLCNLAMVLIPFCYIFKPKRLFYFTYFINVFGAVLAMLMPDYHDMPVVFEPEIVSYWVNHACAFFMPLLGVALKVYDRPKLKQYFYSTIWFAVYFVLVLFCNTLFTAIEHPTNYFFINSLFIADKLGQWAKDLFNIRFIFSLNGKTFEMHPVYQAIYFICYILLGFGVWFVYQLFFDIADSHTELHYRLYGIRQDKIALKSVLNGRSIDEPMKEKAGVSLELKKFSKKYGMNKHYSVKNVSFKVKSGEVFGFLGPNGAGKSTIIKSIVGILPISEGEILVCGYNAKAQPVRAKSQIGFVPDHYALYEKLTGREYINYIADIYEVSKEDREERLSEYIKIFELEQSIDNRIKTYSHGMKQKITIISALIHDPKIWILDEPLTGLDPTSIFQVKECMRKHAEKGNIVFFSSHLIDIVEKLCDRIGIIKHGELQCVTTVEEIESKGVNLEEFYLKTIGDNETIDKMKGQNE